MKKKLLLIVLGIFFYNPILFSQVKIITKLPDSISHWKKENKVGFDISEIAFVNWSAGGNNSVSGLLNGQFKRFFIYDNMKWNNELLFKYGVNKQDGNKLQKTDDALQLNSTFGFRRDTVSNWFYSAKFNFNTQFTNGYSYPNRDKAISKLFAPAYLFLGAGTEYVNKEQKLAVYISPLTFKTTFVLDQKLANEGAFGVTKAIYDINGNLISEGRKSKTEMGFLLTGNHKDEIFRNIFMENRLVLYSDYINKFGNIDVDWQLQLNLIVNEYVKANIGTHLIYDEDIKAKKEVDGKQITTGPKLQLKQILGVGLEYNF